MAVMAMILAKSQPKHSTTIFGMFTRGPYHKELDILYQFSREPITPISEQNSSSNKASAWSRTHTTFMSCVSTAASIYFHLFQGVQLS